jgi:anti-sigma regulatory factor (Ser/Thr protein kinase)
MPEVLLEIRLPPAPTAPGQARRALDPLEGRLDPETLYALRLMISELVTNCVRHAGMSQDDAISLRVVGGGDRVRVEVVDQGWGFGAPSDPVEGGWQFQGRRAADWPGGWGLSIVEALADTWGVTVDRGTTVWFEMSPGRGTHPRGPRPGRPGGFS